MKKPIFILLALPSPFYLQCLERSAALDIPGALRPTAHNCSPEGGSRLALIDPDQIHGSRATDVLRSLEKNARNYFYEACAYDTQFKNQMSYLNALLKQTTDQLAHLMCLKKKTSSTHNEQTHEIEINLLIHKLDACALHMAITLLHATTEPRLNRV